VTRAALVTGGGSGIGAAVARRLTAAGMRVCVSGRRREPLEALAREIGGLAVCADTGDAAAVERTVGAAVGTFGRLDVLVCSAGTGAPGAVLEQTIESWSRVLRTNLTGAFLACRAALPHLLETRGAIVTVSSLGGLRAAPGAAAYSSSKAGLVMLTRSIALDYGPAGVRANCVCPGWVRTPIGDGEMDELAGRRGLDREAAYALATATTPLRRPGEPEEVAEAVAWLAGDAAAYVNGAVVSVDGGAEIVDAATVEFGR
jgi:meso-butanediol dehydrogenase / (S,S)-butanediol dehydrogenase / diacetyl reductase